MEIKRDAYLDQLIRKQHNGLIKVVTGVKRCGKSYLLFNIFHNYLMEQGIARRRKEAMRCQIVKAIVD